MFEFDWTATHDEYIRIHWNDAMTSNPGTGTPAPNQVGQRNVGRRPDHFVGIRIKVPETELAKVRKEVLKRTPAIEGYMEELHKAHVTIGVLRLDTPEKLERCTGSFRKAAETLRGRDLFGHGGFRMVFDSLDMFGSRVLFLKPSEESSAGFREIRSTLFDGDMVEFDADTRDDYIPHLTIAKQTRWVSKSRNASIKPQMPADPSVYDGIDVDVRDVAVEVQLVKMRGEKEKDGYYKIIRTESLI